MALSVNIHKGFPEGDLAVDYRCDEKNRYLTFSVAGFVVFEYFSLN